MNSRGNILMAAFILLLAAALGGCLPTAFTPEAGAAQAVVDQILPDFQVDPQSIEVTQSGPIGENVAVQVRFQGIRAAQGREECLGVYEMHKTMFGGWTSGSGGTGCASSRPPVDEMPFRAGQSTFSDGNPQNSASYAIAHGEIYNEDITHMLVTWNDGNTQQVEVVNRTFMAIRPGSIQAVNFDALDKNGEIVHSTSFGRERAPGKQ